MLRCECRRSGEWIDTWHCCTLSLFYIKAIKTAHQHVTSHKAHAPTSCLMLCTSRAPQLVSEFNDDGHGLRMTGHLCRHGRHPRHDCGVRLKVEQVEGGGLQLVELWDKRSRKQRSDERRRCKRGA